jgi:hypothetical protein
MIYGRIASQREGREGRAHNEVKLSGSSQTEKRNTLCCALKKAKAWAARHEANGARNSGAFRGKRSIVENFAL